MRRWRRLTVLSVATLAFAAVERAATEREASRLLAARWWRSRAIRLWARTLSVTCPLTLALVVVLLELRANNALERMRLETTRTRSRRRNVMKSLPPEYLGKFLLP